jgi:hypothetical protein
MWYKLALVTIMIAFFSGCSSKKADINYDWQVTNTVIHDKIITLNEIKVREIKYYTTSKKNWKDGTTSHTAKEDRYLYLNPSEKLDIKNGSFQDISKKYNQVILFKGDITCKEENYPCSIRNLMFKGEVYKNTVRNSSLSQRLSLSSPVRINSEKDMHNKVYNFLKL